MNLNLFYFRFAGTSERRHLYPLLQSSCSIGFRSFLFFVRRQAADLCPTMEMERTSDDKAVAVAARPDQSTCSGIELVFSPSWKIAREENGLVCTSIRAVFSRRHLRNEETKCTEERGCRSCVRLWARVVRAGHELNLNGPGSSPCGSTGKHLTKKN